MTYKPHNDIYFNLLKTKRNPLYIRTQSVPRCKHFPPLLYTTSLLVYKAKFAVIPERYTEHTRDVNTI